MCVLGKESNSDIKEYACNVNICKEIYRKWVWTRWSDVLVLSHFCHDFKEVFVNYFSKVLKQ